MINWKKVEENIPTNKGKSYPNSPETPYVTCLIWVCNPNYINGGSVRTARWDTVKQKWHNEDIANNWGTYIFDKPHQITHFCDDINSPQ